MKIDELYTDLAPKVTNYLVANGTPYHAACDIVQETFLKVWKMRDTLQEDMHAISGLIYTIARNLRTDALRHGKFIVYEAELRDEDVQEPDPSPSDAAYLRSRIREAFNQLPPLLRDTYALFQIAELPIREIARLTNVSESLVKVRIFRAKGRLRLLLKDLAGMANG